MDLYASHLGWLHSIPNKATQSRLSGLSEDSASRIMPVIYDDHISSLWEMIGYSNITTSGPESIRHLDIASFMSSTGYTLSPFCVRAIKSMSEKYVLWYMKGSSTNCAQPFISINIDTSKVNDDISTRIKAMARSRRK